MKLEEYRKKLRQDPEYIAAEKELKPILDLADKVLDLRLEKGWSQAELAERAGVNMQVLAMVESGVGSPAVYTLWRLAEALGTKLSIDFVIEEQDSESD